MLLVIYDPPFSPSPHSPHLCQRAPSCGNTVRLALLLTGCRSQSSAQFLRGDQEPWAFRGGLAGEFQVSNALNLQLSNGKSVIGKEDNGNMWQVWRALVCRRSAECIERELILRGFKDVHALRYCQVLRMGDFPSSLKSSRPVFWHSIFSLINFNFFQQLPKEMLLFPSASGAREHG